MILVVADDLSGAAELAGIAASRGLSAEVHIEFDSESDAGVIAVDAESRSLPAPLAAEKTRTVIDKAAGCALDWIYKKTDSALRGNIRAELEALLESTNKKRVLFLPANPLKERRIRDGQYVIGDTPLAQTVFADDPDHPQPTSDVVRALGADGSQPVRSIRAHEISPESGIVVPDAESSDDIARRAREVDRATLAAGAAEFFTELLDKNVGTRRAETEFDRTIVESGNSKSLFLCGSLAAWDQGVRERAREHGITVFDLEELEKRPDAVLHALETDGRAFVAIGRGNTVRPDSPAVLLDRLIRSTVEIIQHQKLDRVFLEGGATASALVHRMNWTRFTVLPVDLLGVGCLRPGGSETAPRLFIKPGSYPWPDAVWRMVSANGSDS
jgi:uncharacterized protein YgbK (DUF1537 family)